MQIEKFGIIIDKARNILKELFDINKIPESHGLNHCDIVLQHMENSLSINSHNLQISKDRQLSLLLGALLHEADDHKYFDKTKNAENILLEVLENQPNKDKIVEESLEVIDLVSASDNGNSIPERCMQNPELLWVRFCDRLEAVGKIGVVRCYQFTLEKKRALDHPEAPKPTSIEDVWKFATKNRFDEYMRIKTSRSMIDHYYDK